MIELWRSLGMAATCSVLVTGGALTRSENWHVLGLVLCLVGGFVMGMLFATRRTAR